MLIKRNFFYPHTASIRIHSASNPDMPAGSTSGPASAVHADCVHCCRSVASLGCPFGRDGAVTNPWTSSSSSSSAAAAAAAAAAAGPGQTAALHRTEPHRAASTEPGPPSRVHRAASTARPRLHPGPVISARVTSQTDDIITSTAPGDWERDDHAPDAHEMITWLAERTLT